NEPKSHTHTHTSNGIPELIWQSINTLGRHAETLLQIVYKDRLLVRVAGTERVEKYHSIGFDECPDVHQVHQDGSPPDKNGGQLVDKVAVNLHQSMRVSSQTLH